MSWEKNFSSYLVWIETLQSNPSKTEFFSFFFLNKMQTTTDTPVVAALSSVEATSKFNKEVLSLAEWLNKKSGAVFPKIAETYTMLQGAMAFMPSSSFLIDGSKTHFLMYSERIRQPRPNESFIQTGLPDLMSKFKEFPLLWGSYEDEDRMEVWRRIQTLQVWVEKARLAHAREGVTPAFVSVADQAKIDAQRQADRAAILAEISQQQPPQSQPVTKAAHATNVTSSAAPASAPASASSSDGSSAPPKKKKVRSNANRKPNIDRSKAGGGLQEEQLVEVVQEMIRSPGAQQMLEMVKNNPDAEMDPSQIKSMLANLSTSFGQVLDRLSPNMDESTRASRRQTMEQIIGDVTGMPLSDPTPEQLLEKAKIDAEQDAAKKDRERTERCSMIAHFHQPFLEIVTTLYQWFAIPNKNNDQKPWCGRLERKCVAVFLTLNDEPLTEVFVNECCAFYKRFKARLDARDESLFERAVDARGVKTWNHPMFSVCRTDFLLTELRQKPKNLEFLWTLIGQMTRFIGLYSDLQHVSIKPLQNVINSIMSSRNMSADRKSNEAQDPDMLFNTIRSIGSKENILSLRECAGLLLKNQDWETPFNLFVNALPPSLAKKLGLLDDEETTPPAAPDPNVPVDPATAAAAATAASAEPKPNTRRKRFLEQFLVKKPTSTPTTAATTGGSATTAASATATEASKDQKDVKTSETVKASVANDTKDMKSQPTIAVKAASTTTVGTPMTIVNPDGTQRRVFKLIRKKKPAASATSTATATAAASVASK